MIAGDRLKYAEKGIIVPFFGVGGFGCGGAGYRGREAIGRGDGAAAVAAKDSIYLMRMTVPVRTIDLPEKVVAWAAQT